MAEAVKAGTTAGLNQVSEVMGAQLPLSFLKIGESAIISKVRGKGEVHHHLENLGFVEGASVRVICENGGNLIVEIKGTQVALNKQTATRIITR